MKEYILEINFTIVKSVGNYLCKKETWKDIKEFIFERNLSGVRSVGNHLHGKEVW